MDLTITTIDLVKGDIVLGGTLELIKGLSVEIIYSTKSWEKLKKKRWNYIEESGVREGFEDIR